MMRFLAGGLSIRFCSKEMTRVVSIVRAHPEIRLDRGTPVHPPLHPTYIAAPRRAQIVIFSHSKQLSHASSPPAHEPSAFCPVFSAVCTPPSHSLPSLLQYFLSITLVVHHLPLPPFPSISIPLIHQTTPRIAHPSSLARPRSTPLRAAPAA